MRGLGRGVLVALLLWVVSWLASTRPHVAVGTDGTPAAAVNAFSGARNTGYVDRP